MKIKKKIINIINFTLLGLSISTMITTATLSKLGKLDSLNKFITCLVLFIISYFYVAIFLSYKFVEYLFKHTSIQKKLEKIKIKKTLSLSLVLALTFELLLTYAAYITLLLMKTLIPVKDISSDIINFLFIAITIFLPIQTEDFSNILSNMKKNNALNIDLKGIGIFYKLSKFLFVLNTLFFIVLSIVVVPNAIIFSFLLSYFIFMGFMMAFGVKIRVDYVLHDQN